MNRLHYFSQQRQRCAPSPVAIFVPQNAQSLDISGLLEANRQAPGRCNYDVRLLSAGPDLAVTA